MRWFSALPFVAGALLIGRQSIFVSAFPAFNTPNSVDTEGNACPLSDRQKITCPLLCVQDFDDCPGDIKPATCKSGEQLCDDGTCQTSCTDIINPCLCGFDKSQVLKTYKACPVYSDTVTVKEYNPAVQQQQIAFTCAQTWGIIADNYTFSEYQNDTNAATISDWGANSTAQLMWNNCPNASEPKLDFTESFCIAFYAIIGAQVLLYSLWHAYKRFRERHALEYRQLCSPDPVRVAVSPAGTAPGPANEKIRISDSASGTEKQHATISEVSGAASDAAQAPTKPNARSLAPGIMLMRGFHNNVFGTFLYYLTLLATAGWLVLFAIIVSDYYGKVRGGVAYGMLANSNTSMAVFIFVWHLGGLWLVAMLACMHKLRNYFRIECALADARVVQVEKRQEEVAMMENERQNPATALVNRIHASAVRKLNFDIITETCPVHTATIGSEDRKYIEYHCTRYSLDPATRRFKSIAFTLGKNHRELLAHRSGLDAETANDRESLVGENFIRVKVPIFPVALLREFFSYIYLYQMMCMWVWFYFNYYKMALVQFCVIVISAIIKVVIGLISQNKVKSLAEHIAKCKVKRDGKWQMFNTADLVPGDIVGIEPGMDVMCDGCVISGEVVVDESSLTGEAMPVRKFALKNDEIPFRASGSGKSYTLFAGTKVLQCSGSTVFSPSPSQPTLASPTGSIRGMFGKRGKIMDVLEKGMGRTNSLASSDAFTASNSSINAEKNKEFDDDMAGCETQMLVLSTRTATDKGKLIQRILFPTRYSFVFDEELRVAILILLTYAGFAFAITLWLLGHDVTSWFYGIFVISQCISPLLPAALVAGQTVAAGRLRKKQIYCVDLPRIMLAGKVQVFCFDKTGTLTKEGLEYYAVQGTDMSSSGTATFRAEEPDMSRLEYIPQIGFAACHAVTMVDGAPIGNPVDVEQFRATDWEILPKSGDSQPDYYLDSLISPFLDMYPGTTQAKRKIVHVVKRFEFVHARQSMSVAVYDPDTRHVHVFVKGSFERLKRISRNVPEDYDTRTAQWAKEGCYVLALAHRDLGEITGSEDEFFGTLNKMPRDEMEYGCEFASLLLFRNKLKDDTKDAIAELKAGDTRTVMITGDTALTGVYIARQCGMVSPNTRVILGDIENTFASRDISEIGDQSNTSLVWRDAATDEIVTDIDELLHEERTERVQVEHKLGDVVSKHTSTIELAVTARAFDHLVATNQIRKYLFDIRIFARMTPQGKVDCVSLHMERAITAMCGDGGNDSGALRRAHVGIALTGSEASIVSPFSSNDRSIHACVTLLRHGRAALATSFAGYKFLISYATTMSMLEIVQFYFSVIVTEAVWIMIDSFITVGLVVAITQAKAAKRLAPFRPTARLIGPHTLASIWGHTVINYAFLFGIMALLFRQTWFRCHEFDSRDIDTSLWWLLGDNYESEIISIVCLFQFINGAAVYNYGYRYRRSWITNYVLVIYYFGCLAVASVLTLADPNRFSCVFRINCGSPDVLVDIGYSRPSFHVSDYNSPIGHNVLPHKFRWTVWGLCVANVVITLAYQKLVVLGPVGRLVKAWWVQRKGDSKLKVKL